MLLYESFRKSFMRKIKGTLDKKAIGDRIREIRGFKLNQEEFAQLLGVKRGAVSKYERGEAIPRAQTLLKLSDIGGVSVDWILKGGEKE